MNDKCTNGFNNSSNIKKFASAFIRALLITFHQIVTQVSFVRGCTYITHTHGKMLCVGLIALISTSIHLAVLDILLTLNHVLRD